MASGAEQDLSQLPTAYRQWRASTLGQITDRIEEALVLDLIGAAVGKRLLDVGCGDGAMSVRLAKADADVTGLDNSPRMLAAARSRAEKAGSEIAFSEGDALTLPFADNSFDIVVAVTVLCFVSEPERAFREMARVLRPGGRLVVGELGRYSSWAVKRRIAGWLGSRTWRTAHFRTAHELKKLALAAELQVVQVRGAVYYPPSDFCARTLSSFDERLSRLTSFGAAFIALAADKTMPVSGKIR